MDTNSFTWLKMYTPISNLKLKQMDSYLILSPLRKKFPRGLHIIVAEVLASFINANKRITGIQIGDHGFKIVNFADDITIFLTDITCLKWIQLILKLYEDASSSKINFSKNQASAQFPLKYLELTLETLFLITPNGTE